MGRGERTRHAPASDEDDAGWDAVGKYMETHDESMMKDYSDDIDTLLVLAGLFSAILTTFIVESSASLQVDNSATSVQLLAQISFQLESYHVQGPFVNSTFNPPAHASPFVPTSAARWINSQWFLSLLFSLAAAVTGILAKQWIREYQKWDEATAPTRENVLVRRIRYESWEDWHTAAIISSIPAMLELAVVLFVCGLIVFLWTVDVVVAIVVTIFSAIFLIAVATFTLLPAFFKRCPYKSPTAWACVLAITAMKRLTLSFYRLALATVNVNVASWRLYSQGINTSFKAILFSLNVKEREIFDWRRRDITGGCSQTCPDARGKQHTVTSLMAMVQTEMSELCSDGSFAAPSANFSERDRHIDSQATTIASEVMHLFAALMEWAAAISNKETTHFVKALQFCSTDLYGPIKIFSISSSVAVESAIDRGIRHVGIWTLFDGIFSYAPPAIRAHKKFVPATAVRRWLHPRYLVGTVGPNPRPQPMSILPETLPAPDPETQLKGVTHQLVTQQHISYYAFAVMLAQEIQASVLEGLSLRIWLHEDDVLFKRRIAELLAAFQYATTVAQLEQSKWIQQSMPILLDTFILICGNDWKEHFDFMFPGLRASLLEVVWRHTTIRVYTDTDAEGGAGTRIQLIPGYPDDDYTNMWLTLAGLNFAPNGSPSREDCYIHHTVVTHAIANISRAQNSPEFIAFQISQMLYRTTAILASAKALRRANGGGYANSIPWLAPLLEYEGLAAKFLYRAAPEAFEDLIEAIEVSGELITGGAEAVVKLKAVLGTKHLATLVNPSSRGARQPQLYVQESTMWVPDYNFSA